MEEIEISTVSGSRSRASIMVREAYKQYSDTNIVLNGLNLTVSEGTM